MPGDRLTVVDVRMAFENLRGLASSVGMDTSDWDVFRGTTGYTLKVRWPGEANPSPEYLGEHGSDAVHSLHALTKGLKAAKDQLHNDTIVPILRQGLIASYHLNKHAGTCTHCQCHVIGSPSHPDWCPKYRRMAEAYRSGLRAVGLINGSV